MKVVRNRRHKLYSNKFEAEGAYEFYQESLISGYFSFSIGYGPLRYYISNHGNELYGRTSIKNRQRGSVVVDRI